MSNKTAIVIKDELPSDDLTNLNQEIQGRFPGSDINSKLGSLDDSLVDLKSEIEGINTNVAEGLARLDDTDLDLSAKVAETYTRLGELDNSYKSLSEISRTIDEEIRNATREVAKVEESSRVQLEELEGRTEQQNGQMAEQHALVTARVNELVASSAQTSTLLNESIKTSTDGMIRVEKKLVSEIEFLSTTTRKRSEVLGEGVDANKARILKLQSVDKALSKRARTLEEQSAALLEKSETLAQSVILLEVQAADYGRMITEIEDQQAKMQAIDEEHAGLIVSIQNNASQLTASVLRLAGLERRHFWMLSSGLLIALLAIAGVFLFQSAEQAQQSLLAAEHATVAGQEITALATEQSETNVQLARLEENLGQLGAALVSTQDQVQSLDGRLSYSSPNSGFGSDNIIHGPQWLQGQPAENLAIRLATVPNKAELYDIAQRYGHYLKDDLFYYPAATPAGEVWVLGYGSFDNPADASEAIRRLPRSINFGRPLLIGMPRS